MLIGGIILGLVFGLLSGGRIGNLGSIHLRWVGLLATAVVIRFATEILLEANVAIVDALRLPILATGFGLLLAGLWVNRAYPGLGLAFVGILLNGLVIVINGGHMPIWQTSLEIAGFTPDDVTSALHIVLEGTPEDFFANLLIFGDVIPIPIPVVRNVASIGDLFLTLGLAFFLFAGVVRVPTELEEREEAAIRARLATVAAGRRPSDASGVAMAGDSGLAPGLSEASALQRPLVLGASGAGLAAPARAPVPTTVGGVDLSESEQIAAAAAATPTAVIRPTAETLARVRRHPYVRLALNGSFSALWAGQLISLFGDRIHQIALAAVVYGLTQSVLAASLVFVAATLPNLILSPVAGTFVDRWDNKEVLVVSDLLRAAVVLLVPIAAVTNVLLVYPLVFLITTISVFFRPARVAILPRIVREDELLSANSAMWVGETMADIIGYPLAGLFVGAMAASLPVAFWLDAATYIASAALLSAIVIRPRSATEDRSDEGPRDDDDAVPPAPPGFFGELKAGWAFLRDEPVLLANTIQATFAQLTVGILTGLTYPYVVAVFSGHELGTYPIYSFVETSQGWGSLVGGFLIGLIGTRFRKGRMIIGGYAFFGFAITLLALSNDLGLVLGFAFGTGIANMVFLIPSQTLFQERTPPALMGRVVGFRFALVFGAMTLAMGLGGAAAEVVGVTTVIALSGLVSIAAGLAGLFVPAVRDA